MSYCTCELRNRAWNPNTGICESCNLRYNDPRVTSGSASIEMTAWMKGALQAMREPLTGVVPPEQLTAENLTAEHYLRQKPPKTWSVVAERAGAHWQAAVRRGVEGSRALLGRLTFDVSDTEDIEAGLLDVASKLVTHAIVVTIEELRQRELFRPMLEPGQFSMHLGMISDDVRKQVVPQITELVVQQFGIRINFAAVGPSEPVWPMRDIVYAEEVVGVTIDAPKRWLVTLSCGHKKLVGEKKTSYQCRECPKEQA